MTLLLAFIAQQITVHLPAYIKRQGIICIHCTTVNGTKGDNKQGRRQARTLFPNPNRSGGDDVMRQN